MQYLILLALLLPLFGVSCGPITSAGGSPVYPKALVLLSLEGCPHAQEMSDGLAQALVDSGWRSEFVHVDLSRLPESDGRRGYASPTILVDGSDLFGAGVPATPFPQCRIYSGGLPSVDDISLALARSLD